MVKSSFPYLVIIGGKLESHSMEIQKNYFGTHYSSSHWGVIFRKVESFFLPWLPDHSRLPLL